MVPTRVKQTTNSSTTNRFIVPQRTTTVRRHTRNTGRGSTSVRQHVRQIPQRRQGRERRKNGLYYDILPQDDRSEIARLGYRRNEYDFRGSLTKTGSIRGSGAVDDSRHFGAEHNPVTGTTLPYVERKRSPKERR